MKRSAVDVLVSAIFILLASFFIWEAVDFPVGGNIFPFFSLGGIIVLSLLTIVNTLISKAPERSERFRIDWSYDNKKPLVILVLSLVHFWLIFILGYFTSAVLFFFAATLATGVRRYRSIFYVSLVLFPAMYAFFVVFLQAQLPRGILF